MRRDVSARLLVVVLAVVTVGVACGDTDGKSPAAANDGGTAAVAGSSSVAGAGVGGGAAGRATTAGSAGRASGGSAEAAGAAGMSGGGGAGEGGGAAGEGGGGGEPDPRPGCDLAALIELSNLRLVEGAGPGESAKLEVEAKNGTPDFVSYNPVEFSCTGDAVANATDVLVTFGISAGSTGTVELSVTFEEDARPGDVARCTVRGAINGQTPPDCSNADAERIDVTVD